MNYGRHPVTPGFQDMDRKSEPTAADFATHMQESIRRAKDCLIAAQQRMQAHYNAKRKDVTFAMGDQVLLSTLNLKRRLKYGADGSNKLLPKFVGPMTVTACINKTAVWLKLPNTWNRVHDVFHVSLVRHYRPDSKITYFPATLDLKHNSF